MKKYFFVFMILLSSCNIDLGDIKNELYFANSFVEVLSYETKIRLQHYDHCIELEEFDYQLSLLENIYGLFAKKDNVSKVWRKLFNLSVARVKSYDHIVVDTALENGCCWAYLRKAELIQAEEMRVFKKTQKGFTSIEESKKNLVYLTELKKQVMIYESHYRQNCRNAKPEIEDVLESTKAEIKSADDFILDYPSCVISNKDKQLIICKTAKGFSGICYNKDCRPICPDKNYCECWQKDTDRKLPYYVKKPHKRISRK